MCAIARALMSGPKLVLLDEPSMGLAPVIVAQVFDLVRRIRSEGYTVLIVEQNVRQVLKIVDRAYLLEVGRIKASGHRRSELAASDEIRKAYMGHRGCDWIASSTSSSSRRSSTACCSPACWRCWRSAST